jgi:hypothetical protein
MFRKLTLAVAFASACAPAPLDMPATHASEVLERFAAGGGPGDICTPEGRAMLRSAVRAYSDEMASAGVAWPSVPAWGGDPDQLKSVDVSVLVAFAGGFVQASDFRGPARRLASRLSFAQWPELSGMRHAARVACEEVANLQHAAARLVLETERHRRLTQRATKDQASAGERVQRQARRLERAQAAMQSAALAVEWRVQAARGG